MRQNQARQDEQSLSSMVFHSPWVRIVGGALALLGGGAVIGPCNEYADLPLSGKMDQGRTKNSVAALIGGVVGEKLWGSSQIDLNVEKVMFPDAKVTGTTSRDQIDALVDLSFTSAHFTAARSGDGQFRGTVDKSEFDWDIRQSGPDTWEVGRAGLKFDAELTLTVRDGKIEGRYERPGAHFNWKIEGTYDQRGTVDIEVSAPMTMGLRLTGQITPRTDPGAMHQPPERMR